MKKILFFFFMVLTVSASAQKVGLVFSGGGAKGLAHVGVLKALEENHIPIDYIVGTSMGAVVGGMYAAGYTPSEIEKIALSNDFQDWVNGRFKSNYSFYFRKKPENPSLVTLKLQVDTGFHARVRSNLVNDIPLNFALQELFAEQSANANNDFDSLFVPFRCIVSDILSQKMIPVSKGSLVEAIRGTVTVPLFYRPIKVDGKYVFDGGLYNNFPVDIVKKDFNPDYIIGSNVSTKIFNEYPKNDEKLINRFLIYMFLSKSDSTSIGPNGTYIQPNVDDFASTNFTPVAELIKLGYEATMADMPRILASVKRRTTPEQMVLSREAFNAKNPPLKINNMSVTGVNENRKKYVSNVFRHTENNIGITEIKDGYYRLVADDNFETVYPRINYDRDSDAYNFELQVQPQSNFKLDLGGNISSRPISNVYVGLQYNYLRRKSYTFSANFYSGGFYESGQGTIRADIPTKTPFYVESEFTYNHWNYYNASQIFVERRKPTYIEQADRKMIFKVGMPLSRNGKIELQSGYINFKDEYSPDNTFQAGDIFDKTRFNGFTTGISVEKNTLNRKQYASSGLSFLFNTNYYTGTENYQPGNIMRGAPQSVIPQPNIKKRSWGRIKLSAEQYVSSSKFYSFGYLAELVLSNKPEFSNYTSTILSAPAFNPLQDSKSLYLQNFRSSNYVALGVKNVFKLQKHLEMRLEGYVFLPGEHLEQDNLRNIKYSEVFSQKRLAATAGLVFHSPVGPVSLSLNHYDDDQKRVGVLFHMGYLIYNKRSLE